MTKGQRIKNKREELKVSQTDLANAIGVSKQTLYKYENDIVTNIPSDVIERLSLRLDCSPGYIMGWDNSEELKDLDPKEVEKAAELYEKYLHAIPEIRSAIDALLKPKSDP